MHIAFVIDNLGSGGAQRQAVEIAARLRADFDVQVSFAVYRDIDFFQARMDEAGIPVTMLAKWGTVDPLFPRRLRRWVIERNPDVVHAFLPMPTIWSALARRRAGPHEPVWIAGERSTPAELRGLWGVAQRWAYRRFDAVTANSKPAADYLVEVQGLPRRAVHYLPNGIDLEAWDRRAAGPSPYELDPERLNLALVGRFSEEKNHRLLLESLSRLTREEQRQFCIFFVGGDHGPPDFRAKVHAAIAAYDLDVSIRVEPPTPDLPALFARLDGLLLPSRFEGFPNVVMEAMASRLAVLASRVGDVPFMIDDGSTGLLVDAGDPAALHAGLRRWLALGRSGRQAMGQAARAAVENRYRIESIAEAHLALYRRLADEMRGAPGSRAADARPQGLG